MAAPDERGFTSAPVQRLRSLLSRRATREEAGAFVVEGVRAVADALGTGATLEVVFAAPEADHRCPELLEAARARQIPVERLAAGVTERVSDTVTPQPVLAVARIPHHTLAELADTSLLVVLADVREPGNAGTIVRSAEAAGASAVVFCRGSVDPWAPKVVRASAGAVLHLPIVQGGDAGEVLEVLAQREVRRLGTTARGGVVYDEVDWSPPTALVFGNEAWGLPEPVADRLDGTVTIPIAGRTESLNVAMAASILLFEATRGRR